MRRPALALALIAAIGLAVVAGGCGSRKTTLGPDLPPETSVYIQGQVNTTNHRVHLFWFGSDPDGYVVAYLMRFVPTKGDPNPKWDTVYCGLPGRCTDSVFTVFTGDSALIHTQFEIRAMDDKGLVDPTPAIQRFVLSNLAPKVHITNPLRRADSTFASVTLSWSLDDPDGGGPGLRYRFWLDGNRSGYDSTTANTITLPSDRFLQGGAYRSGYRTLYLQAVDDGGSEGPLDSTSWFVRAPAKRDPVYHRSLLVIDDSRSTEQNNFGVDTLYVQTLRRNHFPDSSFSVLRLQFSNPFRSAQDLRQTLHLFDAVVWYWGYDFHVPTDYYAPTTLKTYQDVVEEFIDGGGRILLEGLYLIDGRESFGALRQDFVTRYLNCRRLIVQSNADFPDSTAGISTPQSAMALRSGLYADSPLQPLPSADRPNPPGLRGFVVNDTNQVAYWAIAGQLTNLDDSFNQADVPLAMTISRPPGRLIVLPFPSRALTTSRAQPFDQRPLALLLFGSNGLNGLLSP